MRTPESTLTFEVTGVGLQELQDAAVRQVKRLVMGEDVSGVYRLDINPMVQTTEGVSLWTARVTAVLRPRSPGEEPFA